MQQSFLIMQAAYEIIWWQKTRTRWPSHGWHYKRIRNEITPTQPKKQFKAAGMYQQCNIQPSFRKENTAGTRATSKKNPWHFNVMFCSIPPAYVFQHVEQAYRTLFFVPLHTLPKITMQIRDTTVVNHQSTRKQTTTTLSPLPSHPYQVVPAHAGKLPPSLIL